jgi:methionyl aminopeptidase
MIDIKTDKEVDNIREAAKIVADTLLLLKKSILNSGIFNTLELDKIAKKNIEKHKAVPAFLGYKGYPATACISINEEIIHGIPAKDKVIKDGDVVSIDLGAVYNGFYGDAAITIGCGNINAEAKKIIEVTEKSLYLAIDKIKHGTMLGDVSNAIETFVLKNNMTVVKEFCGHGVGRKLHEEPSIPNFGAKGRGPILKTNMTLAIEPMVCLGNNEISFLDDGWTVITKDRKISAHFEHTVVVKKDGCEILSKL